MDGPPGSRANREGDRDADLAAERGHRPEWEIIDRKDLIADKKTRLMSGRALDHPSDDCAASIVLVRECADTRIGDFTRWKDAIQAATARRTDEYVGELVISSILRGVELGVRGAKFRKHRINDDGKLFPELGGSGQRLVTPSHRRPVQSMKIAVVKAVAHCLPHLLESWLMRLDRRSARLGNRLAMDRPRTHGSKTPEGQDVPACDVYAAHVMIRLPVGMLASKSKSHSV